MNKRNWLALIPLLVILISTIILIIILSNANRFEHNINPVFIDLGFIQIRYYGLVYFFAFLILYISLSKKVKNKTLPLNSNNLETFIFFLVIGMVIGARLFEIVFYNPGYYFNNPVKMLKIWEGGLSFHGGLTGICLTTYIYCKKKKINPVLLLDHLVLPAVFFLAAGRFANYINGELYGPVTSLAWGVKFKNELFYRHPTPIYEVFKNLFIFGILFFQKSFKPKAGILSSSFLVLYGLLRFFVEFLKNYESYGYTTIGKLFNLNIAQILSILMFITGLLIIFKIKKYNNNTKTDLT